MTAFKNNLRKGDRVQHTGTSKQGKVVSDPKSNAISAQVIFDGAAGPQYFNLAVLRLLCDGKPEEFPPCDGDLPQATKEFIGAVHAIPFKTLTALDHLRHELAGVQTEIGQLESKRDTMIAHTLRLREAIAALSPQVPRV